MTNIFVPDRLPVPWFFCLPVDRVVCGVRIYVSSCCNHTHEIIIVEQLFCILLGVRDSAAQMMPIFIKLNVAIMIYLLCRCCLPSLSVTDCECLNVEFVNSLTTSILMSNYKKTRAYAQ